MGIYNAHSFQKVSNRGKHRKEIMNSTNGNRVIITPLVSLHDVRIYLTPRGGRQWSDTTTALDT